MKIKNKMVGTYTFKREEVEILHNLKQQTGHSMSEILGNLIRNITIPKLKKQLKADFDAGFLPRKPEPGKNSRIVKTNSKLIMSSTKKKTK